MLLNQNKSRRPLVLKAASTFAVAFAFTILALPAGGPIKSQPANVRATEFRLAEPGYRFQFPRDLRPRNGYRTSWWYYTGHLFADDGGRFGFQFTIFKIENAPNPDGNYLTGGVFFMAHLALTDEQNRKYYFTERLQRFFPGLAGYDAATRTVYVENNTLRIDDDARNHRIAARAEDFQLDLNLTSVIGPVVHGENGVSRKGFEARSFSHYFSIPDLSGAATLKIGDGPARTLRAKAWMDVEFGSNVLAKTQTGWDWLHVSLENGMRYMIFRVRDNAGEDFYSASVITPDGRIRPVAAQRIRMIPEPRRWKSAATGAQYPLHWKMIVEDTQLTVTPWIEAQEAHPSEPSGSRVSYWEGAVDVTATQGVDVTATQGVGYLELTGYLRSMGGTL